MSDRPIHLSYPLLLPPRALLPSTSCRLCQPLPAPGPLGTMIPPLCCSWCSALLLAVTAVSAAPAPKSVQSLQAATTVWTVGTLAGKRFCLLSLPVFPFGQTARQPHSLIASQPFGHPSYSAASPSLSLSPQPPPILPILPILLFRPYVSRVACPRCNPSLSPPPCSRIPPPFFPSFPEIATFVVSTSARHGDREWQRVVDGRGRNGGRALRAVYVHPACYISCPIVLFTMTACRTPCPSQHLLQLSGITPPPHHHLLSPPCSPHPNLVLRFLPPSAI